MNYRTCPDCGANLDPGERCDCKKEAPGGTAIPNRRKNKDSVISLPTGKGNVKHETV